MTDYSYTERRIVLSSRCFAILAIPLGPTELFEKLGKGGSCRAPTHGFEEARTEYLLADMRLERNQDRPVGDLLQHMVEKDLVLGQTQTQPVQKDDRAMTFLSGPCPRYTEYVAAHVVQ